MAMAKGGYKKAALDPTDGTVVCYSEGNKCFVTQFGGFFTVPRADSAFHNAQLAECSRKMNALIEEVRQGNKDKNRKVGFLLTDRGIVLAWMRDSVVSSDDNTEEEFMEALGI